jgi:hypothetical protein
MPHSIKSFFDYKKIKQVLHPYNVAVVLFILLLLLIPFNSNGQTSASPSNWMYPDGNLAATKHNSNRSIVYQEIDSLKVKWFSPEIRGDIQPLIGNIVHNPPIIANSSIFPYSPNEIVAVVGDTLIIIDGAGKLLDKFCITINKDYGNEIIGVSALLDTSSGVGSQENASRTLILGFESIEAERSDSLAVTYIGG